MYYTAVPLDRASARRDDPDWLAARRTEGGTALVPIWRDRCLVRGDAPVLLSGTAGERDAGQLVFLGLDAAGAARFAVDLSGLDESDALARCGADRAVDVRSLVPALPPDAAGEIAYARGLTHWHRYHQFCGLCGVPTVSSPSGHSRRCGTCGRDLFPRIEPAVIVLVELPGPEPRCLLARPAGADDLHFSTVAGFVEVGEGLEDAVRREVAEETGVAVGTVSYRGSQAWPFPAGLMVGFRAVATSDRIAVDGVEVAEARWFTRADLVARIADAARPYRVDSIGARLITDWLDDEGR